MTTINWQDLKKTADESTRPVPDGWYDVIIEKAEATVASTGSDMIKVVLRVLDGPHSGRRLWTNFVLSPESGFALNMFFRNLEAFGVDPAVVAPGGSMDEIAYVLQDRQARAEVGTRVWKGQPRNEVNRFTASTNVQVGTGAVPTPAGGSRSSVPGPTVPGPVVGSIPTTPTVPVTGASPGPAVIPPGPGPVSPPELPF